MPRSLPHRIARWLLFRACSAFVVASRKGFDFVKAYGVPERLIFLSPLAPAVGPAPYLPGLAERPFDLVWCAAINDDPKNFGFFVSVCEALASTREIKVRIVGAGPAWQQYRARLEKCEKLQLQYEGHVQPLVVPAHLASARLLLLPSVSEGWALVCNEAMLSGTPCVVSPHVGAGGELVEHERTGIVASLDVSVWADEIARLLVDEPHWRALSRAARERARSFDLASAAAQYVRGIRCALERP